MAAKKGKMAGRSFTDPILLAPTQTEGEEVRVVREVVPESELPLSQPLFGEGEEEEEEEWESGQRSVPPPPPSPLPNDYHRHLPSGQLRYPRLYDHLPSWVYELVMATLGVVVVVKEEETEEEGTEEEEGTPTTLPPPPPLGERGGGGGGGGEGEEEKR